MDNKKNKVEEPYSPENTPNPPQIIDPNNRGEEGGNNPVETKRNPAAESKSERTERPATKEKKEKLLNEDADITDETTL